MADYSYWRQALAAKEGLGEKPKMFVDHPEIGFYQKGIYVRDANGNKKRVDWMPVAIFMTDGINAQIGDGPWISDRDTINELWSYVAANPITELQWRNFERGEPWQDNPIPAADRAVTADDNGEPVADGPEVHATAIENAKAAAPKTVTNAEEAATAAGSMNRLAELRLACDKAGKAIYEPLYRDYTAKQKAWSAPVKTAQAEEKRLLTDIQTFQESERKRLAKEAEEATAKQDIAADPVPVAAPAPIKATYGTRTVKAEPKLWAVINDYAAALAYFKNDPEIMARVKKLATDAVRAGKAVPGVSSVEAIVDPST